MCGDWPRADIYAQWPKSIADELSSFVWPIEDVGELDRLFSCDHAQPMSVCGGEFTAACRAENERQHREVTLSVDLRRSLVPGVHACLDMRLVLHRKHWRRAFLFPPCTHQTFSDTIGRPFKEQDGRMFFYILFVLWCYCTPALMLLTEQPRTRIPDFFINPTQTINTSEMGDDDNKVVCLYERGRARLRSVAFDPAGRASAACAALRGPINAFADAAVFGHPKLSTFSVQAVRAIKVRRGIEREAGLIMAIPEKRMLGTWGLWLGILIFSQLGFILVPKAKLLRASQAVVATINAALAFDDYRSLCGLLEHIRHALFLPRSVMHGLYFPHGPHGEGRDGPSTIVRPNPFMTSQLQRWCHFLSVRAGSYFTAALRRASVHGPSSAPQFYASSDAATDSQPPGLGGYMHGMYWYLALSDEMVRWLHISVLELLATGFSTIIFTPLLPPNPNVRLTQGADASATATTLTRQTERSNMLQLTHHALLMMPISTAPPAGSI